MCLREYSEVAAGAVEVCFFVCGGDVCLLSKCVVHVLEVVYI